VAEIRFKLVDAGELTLLTVSPVYQLQFGIPGALMDFLLVRRIYRKGMKTLLKGLKQHAEAAGS